MQIPRVHPQTWFLSCDLAGGHRLAEVRLKRVRIRMLCCSVGVQYVIPIPDSRTLELARTTSAAGDHPNRLLYLRLLYWNPVLVFVSMDPVWG